MTARDLRKLRNIEADRWCAELLLRDQTIGGVAALRATLETMAMSVADRGGATTGAAS